MTVVKILFWTGCGLLAIPVLYVIGGIIKDFVLYWKRSSWESRMDTLFCIGCVCILSAVGVWCIVRAIQVYPDADSSTDIIEQNSTPGGKLQPIGVTANEDLYEGRQNLEGCPAEPDAAG